MDTPETNWTADIRQSPMRARESGDVEQGHAHVAGATGVEEFDDAVGLCGRLRCQQTQGAQRRQVVATPDPVAQLGIKRFRRLPQWPLRAACAGDGEYRLEAADRLGVEGLGQVVSERHGHADREVRVPAPTSAPAAAASAAPMAASHRNVPSTALGKQRAVLGATDRAMS